MRVVQFVLFYDDNNVDHSIRFMARVVFGRALRFFGTFHDYTTNDTRHKCIRKQI